MYRISPQAEHDLDDIWLYIARGSGSMDMATRYVDTVTDRFLFLVSFPRIGRPRDQDFGAGMRTYPVGEYIILYLLEDEAVSILRVVHGRRDLEGLFSV